MTSTAEAFRAMQVRFKPLLNPSPWDAGPTKVHVSLGIDLSATTSSGFAMTLGRCDGAVTRDEALDHAATIVEAVDVPVSADLENCFADEPDGVAATISAAVQTGLAGCSVEDWSGSEIYPMELATERVQAAAEAANSNLVLTARAENHLHGKEDLADTIARLQTYQEAGADVLYAPGITSIDDIRSVLAEVDRPVNVLAMPAAPPVSELAAAGVARISVGGSFAFTALGALVAAARELREHGTYSYSALARDGRSAITDAFG